jgi:alkylation response protein AidB-like acyl-CoA dehydrogenase
MTQSSPLAQYESADAIERWMGDPNDASCVLGLKRSMELDELEQYPEQACREIDRWGLRDHYVPREYGGSFGTIEELFALIRAVARRDVTVAIAHVMSYVASIAVWMRGSDEQKRRLAEMFKSGASVAIALTEPMFSQTKLRRHQRPAATHCRARSG